MTSSALLSPNANVEIAWMLDESRASATSLLKSLGTKSFSLNDVTFVPPIINGASTWAPLRRAVYDPLGRELRLEWKVGADKARTELRYAGKGLKLSGGTSVLNFSLQGGVAWVEMRNREDGATGLCPIEVPVETLLACDEETYARTPEDLLRMLGSMAGGKQADSSLGRTAKSRGNQKGEKRVFLWSERVRDLAARMRYFEETLLEESHGRVERQWLISLFEQIHKAHDPAGTSDEHEQVWRAWVRLELWLVAKNMAKGLSDPRDRTFWRKRTRRFRRLGITHMSDPVKKQIHAVIRALREDA